MLVVFGDCRYGAIDQWLAVKDMLYWVHNKQVSAWLSMTQLVLSVLKDITGFCMFMKFMRAGMDHGDQLGHEKQQDSKQMPPDH